MDNTKSTVKVISRLKHKSTVKVISAVKHKSSRHKWMTVTGHVTRHMMFPGELKNEDEE